MKVILAVATTAALLAGAAIAGTTSPSPTSAQFKALSKRVAALERTTRDLKEYVDACLHDTQGVTEYGDSSAPSTGYVFADHGAPPIYTTALDITNKGDKPQFWFLNVPGPCVQPSPVRLYSYRSGGALRRGAP